MNDPTLRIKVTIRSSSFYSCAKKDGEGKEIHVEDEDIGVRVRLCVCVFCCSVC